MGDVLGKRVWTYYNLVKFSKELGVITKVKFENDFDLVSALFTHATVYST